MKQFTIEELLIIYEFGYYDKESGQKLYNGTTGEEKKQYLLNCLELATNKECQISLVDSVS